MRLRQLIDNQGLSYILINIFISSIGFIRSFVYIKTLTFYDLGLLTIMQTIIMLIGMFQFGLISGCYRILSVNKNKSIEEINNLIFTFFVFLLLLLFIIWILLLFSTININKFIIALSFLIGIITLLYNWIIAVFLSQQKLKFLNTINVISSVLGLLALGLVFYLKLFGAILAIFVQPLSFVMISLICDKKLRPRSISFNIKLARYILSFGLIPFLTTIFVQINSQIERWGITTSLGLESLGKFYLVFIYSSLFVLIPSSLYNLFYPKAVSLLHQNDEFKRLLKMYGLLLILYNVFIFIGTIFFLRPVVNMYFQQHVLGVNCVYYVLPGLILLSFVDIVTLIFNSFVRLKPLLWSYFTSTIIYFIMVFVLIHTGNSSLKNFAIIKSIGGIYIFIFCYLVYFSIKKSLKLKVEI